MNDSVACIFDMDELLLASVPQWRGAIDVLLAEMGASWSPELAALYTGKNARDVAITLHRELSPAITVEQSIELLRSELLQRFATDTLVPMPGAVGCVRRLEGKFPLAVASGSPLPGIETAMETLGIKRSFETILSSESVPRGKPHPDVFLAAAAAMGAEPGNCVVLEDSLVGVQAAMAGGMKVIAVPSGYARKEISRLADVVADSLEEVTAETVHQLFK